MKKAVLDQDIVENKKKQMKCKILTNVYEHDWEFLMPSKSGVVWRQQTRGVLCNHVHIEGVFIPLRMPFEWDKKAKKGVNLLEILTTANYHHRERQAEKIWKKIKKEMGLDFRIISAPKGQPENQEGLSWIKITMMNHDKWDESYRNLTDKTMALIYPNCD